MREARVKLFATIPIFIDHTHQFQAVMPILRCALLRTKLTFAADGLQDMMVSKHYLAIIKLDIAFLSLSNGL